MALQSTGVYWIPLYDILEECGFQVYLVNARHTKNLPGRKSDVQESQWLLKLHTYGLLNNSFQPPSKTRTLRTYWRQRLQQVTHTNEVFGGLNYAQMGRSPDSIYINDAKVHEFNMT